MGVYLPTCVYASVPVYIYTYSHTYTHISV